MSDPRPTLHHECPLADSTGLRSHHPGGAGRGPKRCTYCGAVPMVTLSVWDVWEIAPDEMNTGCATLMGQREPDRTVSTAKRADAIAGPTHTSRRTVEWVRPS